MRGIHFSPTTEFKKGQRGVTWVPVGTEKIRTQRGVKRVWVKVGEPHIWRLRAVVVWEREHGPIPNGMIVHHDDRNTLNDNPLNLILLSRQDHFLEHCIDWAMAALRRAKERAAPISEGESSPFRYKLDSALSLSNLSEADPPPKKL